ncbi:MAG: hypothetical protein U0905_17955 [Pirellulales bacterium]
MMRSLPEHSNQLNLAESCLVIMSQVCLPYNAAFIDTRETRFYQLLSADPSVDVSILHGVRFLDAASFQVFWFTNFDVITTSRFHIPSRHPIWSCNWTSFVDFKKLSQVSREDASTLLMQLAPWKPASKVAIFGGPDVAITTWRNYTFLWNIFLELNNEAFIWRLDSAEGLMTSPQNLLLKNF